MCEDVNSGQDPIQTQFLGTFRRAEKSTCFPSSVEKAQEVRLDPIFTKNTYKQFLSLHDRHFSAYKLSNAR